MVIRLNLLNYLYICVAALLFTVLFLYEFNVPNSKLFDLDYVKNKNNEQIYKDFQFVKKHLPPSASFLRYKNESDIAFCTVSVPRSCLNNKNILDRTVNFLKYSIANDPNHEGLTASIDVYDVTRPDKYHETAYEVERDPMVPVHHLFKNAHNHNQSCNHSVECETRDYFQTMYGCSHDFHGKYIVLIEDDTIPAPRILSFISDMDNQISKSDWKPFYVKLCNTFRFMGFSLIFGDVFFLTFIYISVAAIVIFLYHKMTGTKMVMRIDNPRFRMSIAYAVMTATTFIIMIALIGKQNTEYFKEFTGEMPSNNDVAHGIGVFADNVPVIGTQAILYPVAVARRLSEGYCKVASQPNHASDPLILGDPLRCRGGEDPIDRIMAALDTGNEVRKLYYPNLFQHAGFACSTVAKKNSLIFSESFQRHFGASGVPAEDVMKSHVTGDCSCTTSTLLAYLLMIAVAGFVVKHYMSPYKKSDVFSK